MASGAREILTAAIKDVIAKDVIAAAGGIDPYQKLGAFVADGALSAIVEQVYPVEQFKEPIGHAMRSSRVGKILFRFNG
ncbi:MAG TPA: hypothetical protein VGI45_22305 [Terracidiphilus sp.]